MENARPDQSARHPATVNLDCGFSGFGKVVHLFRCITRFRRIVVILVAVPVMEFANGRQSVIILPADAALAVPKAHVLVVLQQQLQCVLRKNHVAVHHQHVACAKGNGFLRNLVPCGGYIISAYALEQHFVLTFVKIPQGLEGFRRDRFVRRDGNKYSHQVSPDAPSAVPMLVRKTMPGSASYSADT